MSTPTWETRIVAQALSWVPEGTADGTKQYPDNTPMPKPYPRITASASKSLASMAAQTTSSYGYGGPSIDVAGCFEEIGTHSCNP